MRLFDRPWCKNSRFYLGEVRLFCDCHGFTRGYSLKIAGAISITLKRHFPQILFAFGQNAIIYFAPRETWEIAGDRIDRRKL